MEMADAMVYGGFREAGYQYVCIDVRYSVFLSLFPGGHLTYVWV